MPSLQIRELPADVYEALAYRAERDGRSLAQQAIFELRRVLSLESSGGRRDVLDAVLRRLERDGISEVEVSPEKLLREDRRR